MPTWASIARDATWLARLKSEIIYPATLLYLDWPTGPVRASTYHKTLTLLEQSWTGVGNLARLEGPEYTRSNALTSFTVGLTSLPRESIDPSLEKDAIGRRAILYLVLFDRGWVDPIAEQIFIGHVRTPGDFDERDEEGEDGVSRKVVDASIEIANGRNPRRQIALYHSIATAAAGDTAWRLAHHAGKTYKHPA